MKEIIDMFSPDLLYSDSALPFGDVSDEMPDDSYRYGLEAVAYLYNKSESLWGENRAVYTQKNRHKEIYKVGVLDIERSQLPEISEDPWQVDTCIGGWFYNARIKYKSPDHVIDILVDAISKNGTMLLNILQKPDGTIDKQTDWLLSELEKWFAINGEAVYGTRPWRISGEGSSSVMISGMQEEKVDWKADDFRFVQRNGRLYAFMMSQKVGKTAVIKSLTDSEHVSAVRLLGYGAVNFMQYEGVLIINLPDKLPTPYVNAFEITF